MNRHGRSAAALLALAALVGVGFVGAVPHGNAVVGGQPATSDMAQVRIFENGEVQGGGTIVDPHWVLTVAHHIHTLDPSTFSVAFGVLDQDDDAPDGSNYRQIDRIVLHPTRADIALLHFADAVPSTIQIPQLAQAAPARYTAARLFGWGPLGAELGREIGLIIDPVARENAAQLRQDIPAFANNFPAGVDPMVTSVLAVPGDSGGGLFDRDNVLLGVQSSRTPYRWVDRSGNLTGRRFTPSFQEPVWYFRDWITQTISGEGTSDPNPPHDELKRRRLNYDTGGKQAMTLPPQMSPIPSWPVATLTADDGADGLATVTCPSVTAVSGNNNSCSVGDVPSAPDTPTQVTVGSGRQVVAWCRTKDSFQRGAAPITAVRFSFTNADTVDAANLPAYGWYDARPTQVLVDKTAIDPTTLAAC